MEKTIQVSRERYAKKKEVVEDKIMRWHVDKIDSPTPKLRRASDRPASTEATAGKQPASQKLQRGEQTRQTSLPVSAESRGDKLNAGKDENYKKNEIYQYNTVCSRCGKATNVSFEPDGIRPVFCKECLAQARKEKKAEIEDRKKIKKEELAELKQKEISIKKVVHIKPVDFHGREINRRQPARQSRPGGITRQASNNKKKDNNGSELKEGEEVRF